MQDVRPAIAPALCKGAPCKSARWSMKDVVTIGPRCGRSVVHGELGRSRLKTMEPLKAHVRNGRLVLDEPTELPEGEVVYLVPAEGGEMDDAERAALHESLAESIDQMNKRQLLDADVALAELRAHR